MITEGRVADVKIAQQLKLPKGSLVVMDRGYIDYKMFERWSAEGVGFVTRLKRMRSFTNSKNARSKLETWLFRTASLQHEQKQPVTVFKIVLNELKAQ